MTKKITIKKLSDADRADMKAALERTGDAIVRSAGMGQAPKKPTSGFWVKDAEALLEMGASQIDATTVRGVLAELHAPPGSDSFLITAEQIAKVMAWIKEHNIEKHGGPNPYGGAIGGQLTYQFTPTSIGVLTSVICGFVACEGRLDLSNYGDW